MKAAILPAIGRPLVVDDVPVPSIGPDEVLIETRTCGICRTDLHIQDGLAYLAKLPHIPGHEPAGVVAALGANVRGLQPGQRVTTHLFVHHGDCRYTRTGQHAQATHLRGIVGVTLPGAFAEFFAVPAANVLPLPEGVSFAHGGLTGCAAITALHAYRQATLQVGHAAVVLGTGGIGLMLVQLLRAGGIQVLAIDQRAANLELAMQHGAVTARPPDDPELDSAAKRCGAPEGFDAVFELVGSAATMALAARLVRRGGRIVVIGEEPDFPAIDTITIAQRELQIVGSRNGGLQDASDVLDLMAHGVVRPVVAAEYSLEQINTALDLVRHGAAAGRVIIQVSNPQ
jgi:propanol-preferring alcohol dehydrogenase